MAETLGSYAQNHVDLLKKSDYINPALYEEYGVKTACATRASLRA